MSTTTDLGKIICKCQDLVDWWRAASNVMSEADGDGPYRDTLRDNAYQLENVLKEYEFYDLVIKNRREISERRYCQI